MANVPRHSSRAPATKPQTRRIPAQGPAQNPAKPPVKPSAKLPAAPAPAPEPEPPTVEAPPARVSAAAARTSGATVAVAQSGGSLRPVARSGGHGPGVSGKTSKASRGSESGGSARRMGTPGLRTKFMLILAVVTAVVMVALGMSMATITNNFLFSQKLHDGIEIARVVRMVGEAVADTLIRMEDIERSTKNGKLPVELKLPVEIKLTPDVARQLVGDYIKRACDWFGDQTLSHTDVLAVNFDCPQMPYLHTASFGEAQEVTEKDQPYTSISDNRTGETIPLGQKGISVYGGNTRLKDGKVIPIYRFKIDLGSAYGLNQRGEPANVRVDIDARSVQHVGRNLWMTIGVAVLFSILVVVAIANWLASNITRPLVVLMRDMKVVARGNLDHETKPRSRDEIGILAVEFNRMTQNLKVAQAALVEQEKAEYELSIAREVQRQLLPAEAPSIAGFESAAFYQGAKAVSGDYFDFIPLGDGLWGFIIADVSGKGIPGSMVMAVTRTIVRLVANKHRGHAAETLKETNRLISKQIKRGMFVTACYAILDEGTGRLTYASAGHNPMVIYRAAAKSCELAQGKGIALGFNEGPVFDKTIQEQSTTLGPGDAFFLYTDGFPEAMNSKNVEFGEDNFYKTIAGGGHMEVRACVGEVVAAVAGHRGDHEQSDDLTMIAVKNVLTSA